MSTNRSKGRSSLCSFTFAAGRHCRTLECGAITLRALCGKSFSALSTVAYLGQTLLSQRVPRSNRFSTIADWR